MKARSGSAQGSKHAAPVAKTAKAVSVPAPAPAPAEVRRDDDDQEIWKQYKATKDAGIREQLILKYAPFVKFIAGRLAMGLPPNVDGDDLVSYGILGLMDAIDKFSLDRNVKFKTYAQQRVRGAILDKLRDLDWTPRSVRQKARKLQEAYVALENSLGRAATDDEVCKHLGITSEELNQLLDDTRAAFLLSLDEIIYSEDDSTPRSVLVPSEDETASPEKAIERKELKRHLVAALESLSERERLVLTLYYYEELTLKEIGQTLGVSDSRVSQLHTKAILKLRARLLTLRGD